MTPGNIHVLRHSSAVFLTFSPPRFFMASDEFFDFQQGQLEMKVDQLQEALESNNLIKMDLEVELELSNGNTEALKERFQAPFYKFKSELTNLTNVIRTFFVNLCEYFEKQHHEEGESARVK